MILRVTENRNIMVVTRREVTNTIKVTSRENKIVFLTTQKGADGRGVPTGGTTGQILAKNSNTNYDTEWVDEQDLSGYATTSELATGLAGKANTVHTHTASQITDFNTAVASNSAVIANTAKISFDSASSAKLAGIEAGADVTDATNVNAAGAVMESDTSTASMAFVVDEDNMASNSATKVPTQQSVKAYVDANAGGAVDSVNGQTGVVVLDADDIDDTSTTHKFTTAGDISKLAGIQAGAEVNVNADWNAVSGDAQILNKPTISGSNTGDVSLAGTPDYITISGQTITRNPIDLATDVTGDLPFANLTQLSAHQVLARAGSGTGDVAGVTMGNDTILGRAGSGDVDDLSATQVRSIINVENGADVTDATNVAAAGAIMDGDFSANGVMTRTSSGAYTSRTLTGTTNQVVITNGDGVAGNPTFALPQDIHTGASPTFASETLNGTDTSSSGTYTTLSVTPTINQSGTAGYRALFINPTETAVGSGTQFLIDGRVGGTSIFHFGTYAASSISGGRGYLRLTNPTADAAGSGIIFGANSPAVSGLFQLDSSGHMVFRNRANTGRNIYFDTNTSVIFRSGAVSAVTTLTIDSTGNTTPGTDSAQTLGSSSLYWSNTYTDRLYLNATADFNGSVAGTANLTGNLGIAATSGSATHSITLGSTATGIALYNTVDQTTNFERLRIFQASNVFNIGSEFGGTGTLRNIRLISGAGASTFVLNPTTQTAYSEPSGTNFGFTVSGFNYGSAGTTVGLRVAQTINQSGTAGYTALLINPTETTAGSGTKLLADFQIGSVTRARIDTSGNAAFAGSTISIGNAGIAGTSFRFIYTSSIGYVQNASTDRIIIRTWSGAINRDLDFNAGNLTVPGDVLVADEAYGAGWNGSLEVPTKNAVYDITETKVTRVVHGSTAGTARPTATYVEWVGSIEPTNATNNDTWVVTP